MFNTILKILPKNLTMPLKVEVTAYNLPTLNDADIFEQLLHENNQNGITTSLFNELVRTKFHDLEETLTSMERCRVRFKGTVLREIAQIWSGYNEDIHQLFLSSLTNSDYEEVSLLHLSQ